MVEADKRQAILEAALSLFVERGFHGTAVPLIAERAGVAAGTIYRYFDGKEDLVNQLYRELKLSLARSIGEDFPLRASPREQFHAFWMRMVRWGLSRPHAFAFLELHAHAGYLDAESQRVQEETLGAGLRLIEGAQKQGTFKAAPPMLLVGVMLGGLVGVMRLSLDGALELDDAALAQAEQACWDAVAREPGLAAC